MGKDLYEVGELPPVGEVPARMHAQLVRPDRYGDPASAIQDEVIDVPGPRSPRRARDGHGGGGELQQRLGREGRPRRRHEDPGALGRAHRLPHRGFRRIGGRVRGRRRRHERAGRRPRRRARGPMGRGRPLGARRQGSGPRLELPRLGVRHLLGIASRSSPRCRRTSACPRPTSSRGKRRPRPPSPAPPPTACCSAGRPTRSSRATSCWSGADRVGSARSRSSWWPTPAAARSPSSARRRRASTPSPWVPSATSTGRTSRIGACRPRGTAPSGRSGSPARRISARPSGTCWARR